MAQILADFGGFSANCHFTKREWAGIFADMEQAHPNAHPGKAKRRNLARKLVIDLAIMTVIGIGMALIGPFGTFAQPLSLRLVSWLGFAYLGYALYSPRGYLVERATRSLDLPEIPLWVLAVAVATVPMTAAVWSMGFFPGPVPMPSLDQALESYFYVFIVGGGVTALFYALQRQSGGGAVLEGAEEAKAAPASEAEVAPEVAPEVEPAPEPANPLLDELPPELGSDIVALEMEDHYVRVHTALGSHLVLMRLRDAMVHVSHIEGRQTHRSWWVARGAVEDVQREGRNVRLVLPKGLEAPVSRAQVSELKEAGWL